MEKRDLYDENRVLTGKNILKGEAIPTGRYINVVLVFIQNDEGNFLIQKRSKRKNGKYATTGGHPKSGESSLEGIITEVKEEIGIDFKTSDLELYFTGKSEKEQVFWDDYYIKANIENINKLKLQTEEVESLRWCSENEIHKMYSEGKFFENHYEEFIVLLKWLKKRNA